MEQTAPKPEEKKVAPVVVEPSKQEIIPHHLTHDYESDLSHAMNATDAKVVQELLTDARERDMIAREEKVIKFKHGWFLAGSFILLLIALGAGAYGFYHYTHLTVTVHKTESVGVFPSTKPVVVSSTDIRQTIAAIKTDTTLPERKPVLIPFVTDDKTLAMITNTDLLNFMETKATEPFIAAISVLRLGAYNDGTTITPFLIASVTDPEIASKEFLIAEPELLRMFYNGLGIDISTHQTEIGKGFESKYLYNLPVRILTALNTDTGEQQHVLLYGYATDNIIVITQKPEVLKAVYETVIKQ